MKLEERIYKLYNLARDYEKLSYIVHSMKINEDAPVYNTEWAAALKERYDKVYEHMLSLKGDLGL